MYLIKILKGFQHEAYSRALEAEGYSLRFYQNLLIGMVIPGTDAM